MERLITLRFLLGRMWITGLSFVFIAWFAMEAFQPENGLPALKKLEEQRAMYQAQTNTVQAELARLQHRVDLMNQSNVDPDMLEEQVRQKLGFVGSDEVIVMD